jgi:hypothetical protein
MAKIQIKDLPGDLSISHEDMRKVHGGIRIVIDTSALLGRARGAAQDLADGMNILLGGSSSSSSDGSSSSGVKPSYYTSQTKDGS